ncbi:alpha/beta hydrolase [Colwellia sp. D2M02]|uniref:alpha/beta fold hydrolase n=1 Tax=Colwellia sp. D2M02 TaxID=2841562 RepID=UPI001C093AD2|nr:alpha/beta hydrolase [Colwellia sp. D2M02]MBU2892759.1 alpha/beta hydrolase [Colwellia sp. D2M02]
MKNKVYLLPGTMCNELLWSKLLPELTCAVSDLEFVHLAIPANKNFAQLAQWLANTLPSTPVALMGFSLGGYIASYFNCCFPERVAQLFVIANSPCALNQAELSQREAILSAVKRYGYQGINQQRINQFLGAEMSNQKTEKNTTELARLIQQMDRELGEAEFLSQIEHTSLRDDLQSTLAKLSNAITFYYAEQDTMVNTPWLEALVNKANNNNITLIKTQGSAHMLPLTEPKALAQQLLLWLER